jgi:hypothetical protein
LNWFIEKYYQSLLLQVNYEFQEKKGNAHAHLNQQFSEVQFLICHNLEVNREEIVFIISSF